MVVLLGGLAVLTALATALIGALVGAALVASDLVRRLWLPASTMLCIIAAVVAVRYTKKRIARKKTSALLTLAEDLASSERPDESLMLRVASLRSSLEPLPDIVMLDLEALYRRTVALVVADADVTSDERARLDAVRNTLAVPAESAERAEAEGFLDVYASVVADNELTEEEESRLNRARTFLRMSEEAVAAQVAFAQWLSQERVRLAGELRRAAAVRTDPLVPIEVAVPFGARERCYYAAECIEKQVLASRTRVPEGSVRTRVVEDRRSGMLYITSARILFVGGGSINIWLDRILDHGVDAESHLLAVTTDGRKSPYLLALGEPFVAASVINRVLVDAQLASTL